MLKRWNWLILLMIVLAPLWGCSDDDSEAPPTAPTQTAFEVMAAAGAAYINDSVQCPGVLNAQVLYDNLASYTVVDIRQQVHYDEGHIVGAIHSSLTTLLTDMGTTIPLDKPIVVACYTGQSAGHAKIALELMGYTDVYSLLFGMSSWATPTNDSWTPNCDDKLASAETTDQNPNRTEQTFPTLSGSASTIVQTQVAAMLQNGFKGITYQAMLDNPAGLDDYYIVNYFGQADYLGNGTAGVPGHVPGAFQYTPYASMGIAEELKYIPANKKVVVYCWTGQHSSQITAYLNMLGYEAYSLKFGSNNLFHNDLEAHKWTAADQGHDFPLEVTPTPVAVH